jgi:hypothetical protein
LRLDLASALRVDKSMLKLYCKGVLVKTEDDEKELKDLTTSENEFSYFAISYYNIIFC